MDAASFDRLSRLAAASSSRRVTLAGLATALSRFLISRDAEAQPRTTCRAPGQVCIPERGIMCCRGATCRGRRCQCPRRQRRCGDRCIPATRCCGTKCGGGAVCRNDRCRCPGGTRRCGSRCVPNGDCCRDRECGACGRCRQGRCVGRCPAGQVCLSNGTCAIDCPGDLWLCGELCVDLQTDPAHCGTCNVVCADEQTCVAGVCECPAGEELCDEQCVNTQSDLQYCGNCETACESGQTCDTGACTCTAQSCNGCCVGESCVAAGDACNGTETCCDEQCVNTQTDPEHCDGCGNNCPVPANGSATCESGQCGIACNAGFHECAGACAPNDSPATCGNRCEPCPVPANGSATCANGQCGIACNPGFHECTGSCVANDSPVTCGNRCAPCPAPADATATCTAGQCDFVCNSGFTECNGACFSPCANPGICLPEDRTVCAAAGGSFCNCFQTDCGALCVQNVGICAAVCANCPTGHACIQDSAPEACLPGCNSPSVICSPPCTLLEATAAVAGARRGRDIDRRRRTRKRKRNRDRRVRTRERKRDRDR